MLSSPARPSFALVFLLFVSSIYGAVLSPRASAAQVCVGLSVESNNGDRKVALVIDSSGSMLETDPDNLRLAAGRALNDWLITKAEATGGKKSDLVTVIDFDDTATLDYPLGDPAGANSSFSKIDSSGGTFIAGGVDMGIAQLTSPGSGSTSGRSSIIVFTDGMDFDTLTLVEAINEASSLGIRVSFGFLDATDSVQDSSVLSAITSSGGVYATITSEDASNNFINFAILNGLTHNDNPAGNSNTLLAGLSISQFISGSNSVSTFYNAQANEKINFTITSITAGTLTAQAIFGGKVINSTTTSFYGADTLNVQAPSAGRFEIKVTAQEAPPNAVYIIGATSNMPIQNCTIAVTGGSSGLSTGGKVGLGLGIPILVAGLGLGAFFLLKHFGGKIPALGVPPLKNPFAKNPFSKPPPTQPDYEQTMINGAEKAGFVETITPLAAIPASLAAAPALTQAAHPSSTDPTLTPQNTAQDPSQKHKHKRHKRRKHANGPYHHHHLAYGHPCLEDSVPHCALSDPEHVCKDPNEKPLGPCVCTDKKCELNKGDHECVVDEEDKERWPPCGCEDEECEVTKEEEKKKREKLMLGGAKIAIKEGVHAVMN